MPDRRTGFTLIEVMVALFVFAIAGLALVTEQVLAGITAFRGDAP